MYNFLTHPCPHKDLQVCLQPMLNAIYSKRKKKVKTIQLTLCFFYFIGSLCTCYCFLHAKEALLLHMYLLTLVNYYMYFIHTLLCIKKSTMKQTIQAIQGSNLTFELNSQMASTYSGFTSHKRVSSSLGTSVQHKI